jgi:hypothetical protein
MEVFAKLPEATVAVNAAQDEEVWFLAISSGIGGGLTATG